MQRISDLPRTKLIRNGEKVTPTFSRQEMGRRNAKLREHMADNDIEAVLFTSYHNINYYSDFLYTQFGRTYGLVVTQDQHVTVSANIDAGMPWRPELRRQYRLHRLAEGQLLLRGSGSSQRRRLRRGQTGGRGRPYDPRSATQGGGCGAGRRVSGRLQGDYARTGWSRATRR